MSKLTDLTENFRQDLEEFTDGCRENQEAGGWDSDNNGDMDDYYVQNLMSCMLRIIGSDGNISRREAEFFNACFGTENTVQELDRMYDDSEDILSGEEFETRLREDFAQLKRINTPLADSYRDLWLSACEILIASDGQLLPQEIESAKRLKQLF